MAIQDQQHTLPAQEPDKPMKPMESPEKRENEPTGSGSGRSQNVIVIPGPFRFPAPAHWWSGITSRLGIAVISIIAMVGMLSFTLGVVQSAESGSSGSAGSSNTTASMNANSTTPTMSVLDAKVDRGNQLAPYVTDPDGAKHFTFTAQQVMWEVAKGHRVLAWSINGMVPGPMIRVQAGDHIRVTFINAFPTATAIHWHGLEVATQEDGVAGVGQQPIQPGQTHVYDFSVHDGDIGTHWYHSHYNDMTQMMGGFYGAFIVDPRSGTPQAKQALHADVDVTEFISTMPENYYVINGKSFPDTQPINVKHGQTVHMRLIGADTMAMHPMHLHGHTFSIVAEDGHPVQQPIQKDTVQVAPGETYDLVFTAWAAPGSVYPFHCHILSHLMNPGQSESDMGGLVLLIEYAK